jgi:DNA-binding MarR family transcriptional regulator
MAVADTFIDQYQRIYFACHQRHVRDVPRGRIVSEQQLHVLGHLDAVRHTKVGELAGHLGLSHSSVSLTIDRLARDGYVVREASPHDGRVTFVRLTVAGEEVRDAQRVLEPDRVAALLRRMSGEERDALRLGMAAIARAAKEEAISRRPARRNTA